MQAALKTLVMVIIALAGFSFAPFAFPFTLITVYVVVFAPIGIGVLWQHRGNK